MHHQSEGGVEGQSQGEDQSQGRSQGSESGQHLSGVVDEPRQTRLRGTCRHRRTLIQQDLVVISRGLRDIAALCLISRKHVARRKYVDPCRAALTLGYVKLLSTLSSTCTGCVLFMVNMVTVHTRSVTTEFIQGCWRKFLGRPHAGRLVRDRWLTEMNPANCSTVTAFQSAGAVPGPPTPRMMAVVLAISAASASPMSCRSCQARRCITYGGQHDDIASLPCSLLLMGTISVAPVLSLAHSLL